MRVKLSEGWIGVDELRPIIEMEPARFLENGERAIPMVETKTEAIYELWFVPTLTDGPFPQLTEMLDGLQMYEERFGRMPEAVVVPNYEGLMVFGVPVRVGR